MSPQTSHGLARFVGLSVEIPIRIHPQNRYPVGIAEDRLQWEYARTRLPDWAKSGMLMEIERSFCFLSVMLGGLLPGPNVSIELS
jgi:hypothetical protein